MKSNRFIKRLDWYIIKKFLGTYVFAIALIISIAVVFDFNEKMDKLMEQMKEKQGVTEELKMQDQMAWVGRMNNIRACAEEIIYETFIFMSDYDYRKSLI